VLSFAVPTCACLQVAVKVLDANAITRRDALTGLSLEVLLAERLRHPFIVNTKAWALVHGQVRGGGGGGVEGPLVPCQLCVSLHPHHVVCRRTCQVHLVAQAAPHLPLKYRHS
jgi:hypothetical protein